MNDLEKLALQNIKQSGFHIVHVPEDYDHPDFSYSIGIEQTIGHPEIVITGLGRGEAASIISLYFSRAKAGESFRPEHRYSGFMEGNEVLFKTVERINYAEYLGWGLWLYDGDSFQALQLIYPSTSGTWPGEANPPRGYSWSIHKLYAE